MNSSDTPLFYATSEQMQQVDDLAVVSGLRIEQMMEIAGFHMIAVFEKEAIAKDTRVVVAAGKGNKGGDGLCGARHLVNHGWGNVSIVLASEDLKEDAAHHRALLDRMGVPFYIWHHEQSESHEILSRGQVVIDALIGYGLKGAPRGSTADIVEHMRGMRAKVISYDMPTGVDSTTGEAYEPHVKADVTLTLGLAKRLFQTPGGKAASGKVYLADIGIPNFLYKQVDASIESPFTRRKSLIQI